MDNAYILSAIAVMTAVTLATRVFPFAVFSRHEPGKRFRALQQRLPAAILVILLAYAVKDTAWGDWKEAAATAGCLILAGGLQFLWKNALISIFVPTILFMIIRAL